MESPFLLASPLKSLFGCSRTRRKLRTTKTEILLSGGLTHNLKRRTYNFLSATFFEFGEDQLGHFFQRFEYAYALNGYSFQNGLAFFA